MLTQQLRVSEAHRVQDCYREEATLQTQALIARDVSER